MTYAAAGIVSAALVGTLAVDFGPAVAAAAAKDSRTFMVAVVQPATQVLWDFGYAEKMTDQDWAKVSKAAADLVGATPTIAAGGVTAAEKARAKSADWQDWSKKLSTTVAAAKRAADSKNQGELATAGDALAEICGGCHTAFDPNAKDPGAP
jgi:cytochrome c556